MHTSSSTFERELTAFHHQLDPHHRASNLSDIILGGQDGLVNVLGVILGVAAATSDPRIVLAAGLAATFAESVSMGAVAFTSTKADHALYESEKAREHRHIHTAPDFERNEIRAIYQQKGFDGPLLDQIVDTITSNKDVWVAVMMAEELRLSPVDHSRPLRSAIIVGISAVIGSLIPLIPFLFLSVTAAMWTSLAISALTLFAVGAYKARLTVGHWSRSGLEMAMIGIASALVGYAVGWLFKVPTT